MRLGQTGGRLSRCAIVEQCAWRRTSGKGASLGRIEPRWNLLLTLTLLAGCGGWVRLGKHEPPLGRTIVVHVGIEGNDKVSDEKLIARLQTFADNFGHLKDKPLLNRSALAADARRIESAYAANGYFQARVTGHRVERFDEVSVRVWFRVREGKETRVESVEVEGLSLSSKTDAEAQRRIGLVAARKSELVASKKGQVWTQNAHDRTKLALQRALRDQGFVYAEVVGKILVSRKERTARSRFDVVPGPLVRCKAIRVTGNVAARRERILRRVNLEPGDIVEVLRLRRTEEDLAALGFFLSVSARPARTPLDLALDGKSPTLENLRAIQWQPTVDVVVTLQERPVHELKAGGGVELGGTRSTLYGIIGYQNRNLFGGQRVLDLTARPAWVVVPSFFEPEVHDFGAEVKLSFTQPSFIEEYLQFDVSSSYELEVQKGYRSHVVDGAFGLRRPFWRRLTPHIGYALEFTQHFDIDEPDTGAEAGIDGDPVLLAYLEQGLTFDWRDNVLDPRNGVFAALTIRESHGAFGSDDDYIFLSADLRLYWTPWRYLSLALRLSWSQNFPLQDESLPEPALIKAGGSTDFRGFAADHMGPALCADGTVTLEPECPDGSEPTRAGGSFRLLGSFELRVYLPGSFGIVAFVDVGQLWSDADDVDLGDIDVAVGPGLRWYSPVGPVRLDLGFLLTTPDAPVLTFHATLGQSF